MPLIESSSKEALEKNIGKEIGAGKPPSQAAAIAYSVQRRAKTDDKKKFTESLHPRDILGRFVLAGRGATKSELGGIKSTKAKAEKQSAAKKSKAKSAGPTTQKSESASKTKNLGTGFGKTKKKDEPEAKSKSSSKVANIAKKSKLSTAQAEKALETIKKAQSGKIPGVDPGLMADLKAAVEKSVKSKKFEEATKEKPDATGAESGSVEETSNYQENYNKLLETAVGKDEADKASSIDGMLLGNKDLDERDKILDAVYDYTKSSKGVNLALREGKKSKIKAVNETIKGLELAFDKAKPLESNIIVFRGMKGAKRIAKMNPGDIFTDDAFISTSTSFSLAKGTFANIGTYHAKQEKFAGTHYDDYAILKIVAPKGSKVLGIKDFSNYESEHEVLLNHNSKFRIVSKKPFKFSMGDGNAKDYRSKRWMIELELIQ